MNDYSGYVRPVPFGYWAMLRLARDGRPKPLMGKGDKPIVFETELDAVKALLHHTYAYMNGDYRRDGARAEASSKADSIFPGLKPIRSKGRVIPVDSVKRRVGR